MDNSYVIVSGATLDLPRSVIEEYELEVIPMNFSIGGKEYIYHPDEREITCKEFYEKLRAGEDSVTSQITPLVFKEVFGRYLKEGKDILYIAFSSGLSGTYNSGRLMAEELLEEYPERKIVCIDSLCASVGEGFLVYLAGKLRKEGKSFEETVEWVRENHTRVCHWFAVDDLNHLKRGGRLNSIEAIVGTALKIKPVLSVDREGKLTVIAKVRGTKKGMEYLRERLINDGVNVKEQTVMVGHADAPEVAEQLKEQLLSEGLVKEVIISNIGPIIGTHVGGGMFALVFLGENYKF
ncbi:MAG: DegV family protein [Lachnospiraceae bacterium]|nr:DegV family protein [Lachnospiraceae bacterium]